MREKEQIIILDSSIFQFQIYTFLLENASRSSINKFIGQIFNLITELNPQLIYLYRENVEETLGYLENKRGIEFLESIWARDQHLPYYKDKPNGPEAYKEFLRDYNELARELYALTPFRKLAIEISERNWIENEKNILDFLNLSYKRSPTANIFNGSYYNKNLDLEIKIKGYTMVDPTGKEKQLIPKTENEFYIEDLPVILSFETEHQLVIKGEQLCDRWTTIGERYIKL